MEGGDCVWKRRRIKRPAMAGIFLLLAAAAATAAAEETPPDLSGKESHINFLQPLGGWFLKSC